MHTEQDSRVSYADESGCPLWDFRNDPPRTPYQPPYTYRQLALGQPSDTPHTPWCLPDINRPAYFYHPPASNEELARFGGCFQIPGVQSDHPAFGQLANNSTLPPNPQNRASGLLPSISDTSGLPPLPLYTRAKQHEPLLLQVIPQPPPSHFSSKVAPAPPNGVNNFSVPGTRDHLSTAPTWERPSARAAPLPTTSIRRTQEHVSGEPPLNGRTPAEVHGDSAPQRLSHSVTYHAPVQPTSQPEYLGQNDGKFETKTVPAPGPSIESVNPHETLHLRRTALKRKKPRIDYWDTFCDNLGFFSDSTGESSGSRIPRRTGHATLKRKESNHSYLEDNPSDSESSDSSSSSSSSNDSSFSSSTDSSFDSTKVYRPETKGPMRKTRKMTTSAKETQARKVVPKRDPTHMVSTKAAAARVSTSQAARANHRPRHLLRGQCTNSKLAVVTVVWKKFFNMGLEDVEEALRNRVKELVKLRKAIILQTKDKDQLSEAEFLDLFQDAELSSLDAMFDSVTRPRSFPVHIASGVEMLPLPKLEQYSFKLTDWVQIRWETDFGINADMFIAECSHRLNDYMQNFFDVHHGGRAPRDMSVIEIRHRLHRARVHVLRRMINTVPYGLGTTDSDRADTTRADVIIPESIPKPEDFLERDMKIPERVARQDYAELRNMAQKLAEKIKIIKDLQEQLAESRIQYSFKRGMQNPPLPGSRYLKAIENELEHVKQANAVLQNHLNVGNMNNSYLFEANKNLEKQNAELKARYDRLWRTNLGGWQSLNSVEKIVSEAKIPLYKRDQQRTLSNLASESSGIVGAQWEVLPCSIGSSSPSNHATVEDEEELVAGSFLKQSALDSQISISASNSAEKKVEGQDGAEYKISSPSTGGYSYYETIPDDQDQEIEPLL
jgi:hypothetical protein